MDSQHFRDTLLALERELHARQSRIERHGRDGLPADSGEQVDARGNGEVIEALGEQVEHELAQVGAALQRIRLGTFGNCTRCGGAISRARLEIIPYTATCSSCA